MPPLPACRSLAVAFALIASGSGTRAAQAQFFDQPGQEFVVSPTAPGSSSLPVVTSTPVVRETARQTRQERRAAWRATRYQTMRPTYQSGPGITFAPFSDRYYPRTIYSRDPAVNVAAPQPTVTTIYPR